MIFPSWGFCLLDRGRENHIGWTRLGISDRLKVSELRASSLAPLDGFILEEFSPSRVEGRQPACSAASDREQGGSRDTSEAAQLLFNCLLFYVIMAETGAASLLSLEQFAALELPVLDNPPSPWMCTPFSNVTAGWSHLSPGSRATRAGTRRLCKDTESGEAFPRTESSDPRNASTTLSLPPGQEQTHSTCPLHSHFSSAFNLYTKCSAVTNQMMLTQLVRSRYCFSLELGHWTLQNAIKWIFLKVDSSPQVNLPCQMLM